MWQKSDESEAHSDKDVPRSFDMLGNSLFNNHVYTPSLCEVCSFTHSYLQKNQLIEHLCVPDPVS